MRRVLITGAYGLLGPWLAQALLARGAEVVLMRRRPESLMLVGGVEERCSVVDGTVTDPEALDAALEGCDAVFHLAAQTIVGTANRSPVPTFEVNVMGTTRLLDACLRHGVERVVVAGSDKAYGRPERLPYTEDMPLDACYPYDVSKACVDLITRCWHHTYGLPTAVTRFANTFGGGDRNGSRLVPGLIAAILSGERPVIRSDGSPEHDFLYVEDTVAAYLAIADALGRPDGGGAAGEAFNGGSDRPYSVREVIDLLLKITGSDLAADYQGTGSPAGELDRQHQDSTKLRALTGWAPRFGLREGLAATVDWYRENPEALAHLEP